MHSNLKATYPKSLETLNKVFHIWEYAQSFLVGGDTRNSSAEEDSWESLGLQGDQTSQS